MEITGATLKVVVADRLTDASAQEPPVVLQTYLTAGEKVCHGRDRLSVAARTGADCQDKITQRETRKFSWLQNLPISFHTIASISGSNSNTIPICEYLIHKPYAVIHPLCTVSLTACGHFCSIFKHKALRLFFPRVRDLGDAPSKERTAYPPAYAPERGLINRKLNMYRAAKSAMTRRIPLDCPWINRTSASGFVKSSGSRR